MCGIVGHIGPSDSIDVVLKGLSRLEYRGYDSAGICIINSKDKLEVYKKTGKLNNLVALLKEHKPLTAKACIGHTRWATHGQVNDTNSHPHNDDDIALVHNGIIENAGEIKEKLMAQGIKFVSETDSEVFLRLLAVTVTVVGDFRQAIAKAFSQVTGNSAFVILDRKTANLYAVKRGAPLVCGTDKNNSQAFVSSDPYALIGMADNLFFPEDNVICALSTSYSNLIKFFEFNGNETNRVLSKRQEMTLDLSEKGDYEHYMLKEIHEQPGLIRSLLQYYFYGDGQEVLSKLKDLRPERIYISACGTANYAGMVTKDYIENLARIPCMSELASEFRYRNPILRKGDMGLFISQSGETADTLASQTLCKEEGLTTLSIVNVEGSSLYRNCHHNLLIRAGVEIGVASTKAFTQQALTGRLLAGLLAGQLNTDKAKKELLDRFTLLADRIQELLDRSKEIFDIAQAVYSKDGFFFTGRGIYYPIALEGALKLKEIAYVHAEGYAAGELKHGPIALIDENKVNIAIIGPELFEKTLSNIQEIKARRGIIVAFGEPSHKELTQISDFLLPLKFDGLGELSPIYVNVANQLFSYYTAKLKGTDIDKPRNLAKSVTVE